MIQQPFALPDSFTPATSPSDISPSDISPSDSSQRESNDSQGAQWWFICKGSKLLVTQSNAAQASNKDSQPSECSVPCADSLKSLGVKAVRTQFLGYLNGRPCVAAELVDDCEPSAQFVFESLRGLHGLLSDDLFAIAARAVQLIAWDRNHQYCGHCATPTTQLPTERAKRCPNCNLRQYPRLSPAVIMLIAKGEQLLLARAPRFRNGMYSVLAGFVEPGESLEETVAREVREEVGLEVKNIRYFGSQPWPFPNSLMIGFTAEYDSGTITPEPTEIEDAAWFDKDALPPVPGELSIARKLIDWFVA